MDLVLGKERGCVKEICYNKCVATFWQQKISKQSLGSLLAGINDEHTLMGLDRIYDFFVNRE